MKNRLFALLAFSCVATLVTGCLSSPHVNSYLILPDGSLTAKAEAMQPVQIMSVTLPAYLKRREMVQIVDGDRVELIPHSVWAENLDKRVEEVLREDFAYRVKGLSKAAPVQVSYVFKHLELNNHGMLTVDVDCILDGAHNKIAFEVSVATYSNPARAYGRALSQIVDETAALVKAKMQAK